MKFNQSFGSLMVAAVAAASFSSIIARAEEGAAAAPAAAEKPAPYCQNNSCKGKSACKGHGNDACKGQNGCKGHGFVEADKAGCKKAGGKWMAKG